MQAWEGVWLSPLYCGNVCHLEHITCKQGPALGHSGHRLDCSAVPMPPMESGLIQAALSCPVFPPLGLVKDRLQKDSLAAGLQTLLAIL